MTENQLIAKLKELKEIKPRNEWVILAKSEVFNSAIKKKNKARQYNKGILEFLPAFFYQRKLALATASFLFVIAGVFGFAQYTMPGDFLFPVKKISEQTQTPLQIAYNRSQDLVQIVEENKTQNIKPAINELKASINDAAKNLVQSLSQPSDKSSIQQIVAEIKKIQDNNKKLETLGVILNDTSEAKELNDVLAPIVEREIETLEKATLLEDQNKTLDEIRKMYEEGKYSDALEKILTINN